MGKRIDVLLIIESVIFILEFKVGEKEFLSYAVDQVWDYALDLKNFHETSHSEIIAPILICTKAKRIDQIFKISPAHDHILVPLKSDSDSLLFVLKSIIESYREKHRINIEKWEEGRYQPTPTIVEAAMALYNNHSVADILQK